LAVSSVWDAIGKVQFHLDAIPILLRHLSRPYPDVIRSGIARALALPEACVSWRQLSEQYQKEAEGEVKDALAATLSAAADETKFAELAALLQDRRHGTSRVLLLPALVASSHPIATETVTKLQDDPMFRRGIRVLRRRLGLK